MSCFLSRRREAVLPRKSEIPSILTRIYSAMEGRTYALWAEHQKGHGRNDQNPGRNHQNREKCQLVHNCRRKDHKLQHRFSESVTEVLN